ncbi:tyrosine-type recombinase/integrase [Saccharopolyspora erythraea]|nr:tyrosine-type recombinase/integrase [Saccharopolyspora erythraea]
MPWLVVDDHGAPVEPVRWFFRHLMAQGKASSSLRSYGYDLLRWWRWLQVIEVEWNKVTTAEVRDFVLWLRQAKKPRRHPRTQSASTAGQVNPVTRKKNLGDGYEARTIRHSNAVLRSFYEYWITDQGQGPLVNPVALDRAGRRANAHHNPLGPIRPEGRIRYNPKLPKQQPRAIPDEHWKKLFAGLRSNRDRAVLELSVSNGARAAELLGMCPVDVDWGEQKIRVYRKGTRAAQWLPASPDAFIWLRLYLAELGTPLEPNDPLWWTLRRRDRGDGLRRQPMNYEALRAVLRRANVLLGTNYTMHDARHTSAIRMHRDDTLSLRDIQEILGHAHLSTTAETYLAEDTDAIIRRVAQHLAERERRAAQPPPSVAIGYDSADLNVLFGGTSR